jgi:hypothetical protein
MLRVPGSSYALDISDHGHTWGFMANRIVNSLEKWLKDNRARLQHCRARLQLREDTSGTMC